MYSFNDASPLCFYNGFQSDITCLDFHYDEEKVFTGTFGGTIVVWNHDTQKLVTTLWGHLTHCWCVNTGKTASNQEFIISGSADTNVKIWDLR